MRHHCCSGNGNSRPSSHDSTAGAHSNGFVIQCLPLAKPSKPTVRQICRIEAGNTPSKRSNTSGEAASPTPNGPPSALKKSSSCSSTQPGSRRSSSITTHYRPSVQQHRAFLRQTSWWVGCEGRDSASEGGRARPSKRAGPRWWAGSATCQSVRRNLAAQVDDLTLTLGEAVRVISQPSSKVLW